MTSRQSRRRAAAAVAALLLVSSLCPAASAAKQDSELKNWADGPIRYIALKREIKDFRSLSGDPDRALYIERFWRRRDPTPDTLVNEYRQLFWERVQQANTNFVDSSKPGWMTDRGKIYILYGPPSEIQEELHLQTQGLPAAGRGMVRWIYEGRPGQRMDLDPVVVVAFVHDAGNEYRLSYDPELTSVFFDANAIRENQDRALDRFLDLMGEQSTSQLSVMLDLGRMQEVPPQEQILLERVETMEVYQTHEVRARVDRYTHDERRGTVLVLSIDLSDTAPGAPPAMVARFAPFDATRQPRLLGEGSFLIDERDGVRVAQGRIVLDPGEYNLTLLVADAVNVRTGLYRTTVRVTEPSDRFRISDLVWASTLESLPYASLASHDEPFHVGPFRVVPKFDESYRRGQSIKLFFEVYGGSFPLQVTYQLQGKEDSGDWVNLGRPARSEQTASAQGWELPTTDSWPPGEYRVLVEVLDQEGRLISRQAPFALLDTDTP